MNFIPLIRPNIIKADIKAASNVLATGMLVQGKSVEAFEKRISEFIGVKHAVAVANGTATMHIALIALGIGKGDEVIVPAFSYIATANVVELVGATPVFVDVVLPDCNINTDLIELSITSRTKAIIPVHEFGLACDIDKILLIAQKHSLHVIEDAACALGATINGKQVGSFGIVGSFSLHPRKTITSGEGGIISTNDDTLAEKFRVLRNHGQTIINGRVDFIEAGFNYRMTDFQAAFVNSQFNRFEKNVKQKEKIAKKYFKAFKKNEKIFSPKYAKNKKHSWQTFHLILEDTINRDTAIISLKEVGIGTNYGAQCIPYMQFYKNKYNLDCAELFPNSLKAYKQGIAVPIYDGLKNDEVNYVIEKYNELT